MKKEGVLKRYFLFSIIPIFLIIFSGSVSAQICEATSGTCYYVAVDGNDSNPGTFELPFKTFLPAVTNVTSGDVIYARGGIYGYENAMVREVQRNHSSYPATSCPEGQVLEGDYCFFDGYTMIAIKDFSGWASNTPPYSVNSGEEGNPIIIRNYPGETPVLNISDFPLHVLQWYLKDGIFWITGKPAIAISRKHHWVIQGFEIIGGNIDMWGGSVSLGLTHDIIIKENNIHDYTIDGGENPGLIRINRADSGGAYNIFIWNNTLHGIYDWEFPGQWDGVPDGQHFGAVTVMSLCSYNGNAPEDCTGYIEIINNTIYEVPQAFFFKNMMHGPIEIRDNVIYDSGSVGFWHSSNVHMIHNLIYGVDECSWSTGYGSHENLPELSLYNGQDAVIENNTFIGLNTLFGINGGTGHLVENNIFFGMEGRTPGAGWGTPAYISKSSLYNDSLDPAQSLLQNITSNNNCFITPYEDFQFVARYLPPESTGGDWIIEHRNYSNASQTFGFDPDSIIVIENDSSVIFVDPDNNDYHLINPELCPGMGYYAEGVQPVCHDVNTDGVVNIIDLVLVAYNQGIDNNNPNWQDYDHLDVNQDNVINFGDVNLVISELGSGC